MLFLDICIDKIRKYSLDPKYHKLQEQRKCVQNVQFFPKQNACMAHSRWLKECVKEPIKVFSYANFKNLFYSLESGSKYNQITKVPFQFCGKMDAACLTSYPSECYSSELLISYTKINFRCSKDVNLKKRNPNILDRNL